MVEMTETANILRNATPDSLVLMDEIGRGTSTYDGLSIAWASAVYLLKTGAMTLFSTHYFELTSLEHEIPGICNLHFSAAGDGRRPSSFTRPSRGRRAARTALRLQRSRDSLTRC